MARIFPEKITVRPDFCIGMVLFLWLLPVKWVLSWCVAASVHELAHYIALRACGVRFYSVTLSLSGAKMETGEMMTKTACIVSLAGPLSGAILVLFGRYIPSIAVCAFFQTIFNLIPVADHDGGRVLQCLLQRVLGQRGGARVYRIVEKAITGGLLLLWIAAAVICRLGMLPFIIGILFLMRLFQIKFPCKQEKQIVQ